MKRIKSYSINISSLSTELEDICLKGIIAGTKDKETAELLACYLREDYPNVTLRLKNIPEFNDGEESITSNTWYSIASNIKGGGFFMVDETPAERIKLIEGYGWLNDEKLSERERFKARDEAQRICLLC